MMELDKVTIYVKTKYFYKEHKGNWEATLYRDNRNKIAKICKDNVEANSTTRLNLLATIEAVKTLEKPSYIKIVTRGAMGIKSLADVFGNPLEQLVNTKSNANLDLKEELRLLVLAGGHKIFN